MPIVVKFPVGKLDSKNKIQIPLYKKPDSLLSYFFNKRILRERGPHVILEIPNQLYRRSDRKSSAALPRSVVC